MRNDQNGAPTSVKTQKTMACTNCRKKKIKCDGKVPICGVCARNKQTCLYVLSRRRGRPSRAGKELERNLDSLPKLLPKKVESSPVITENKKQSPDIESNKSPEDKAASGTSYFTFYQQNHPQAQFISSKNDTQFLTQNNTRTDTQTQSQNQTQNQTQTLAQVQNQIQHQTQSQKKYYSEEINKNKHSLPFYEDKPINGAYEPDQDQSNSQHQSRLSKKPRVSGISTMAKMFSFSNTFASTMVPVIPIHVKSKVYNEPDILLYFHYFNTQYPIIHYPSFREEFDDGTVPNYLIMSMKAIGRRYSKQPSVVLSDNLYSTGLDLSAIATSLAEIAMQHDPNTSLIQTLTILSIFEFGIGKSIRAYDRRNSAIKISYKLGISLLDSGARERKERSLITAESCRRLWWILLYSDRLFSFISCRNSIRPVIDESLFRVDIPRKLVDYQIPSRDPSGSDVVYQAAMANKEFGRFDDYEVVNWFHTIAPLTLIIGHIVYQRQAAYRIFNSSVLNRSNAELLMDVSWINALSEFLRNMLVIDAEIRLWKSELDGSDLSEADSILKMSKYHRKLQLNGVILYHQFLVLYAHQKLKPHIQALSAACTPLLWLKSSAKVAWGKITSATELMQSLAWNKYQQLISNTGNGGIQEHEWEYCAPQAPFFLYLAAKVCISFSHWTSAYRKIKFSSIDSKNFTNSGKSSPSYYFSSLINQLFSKSNIESEITMPELDKTILEIESQVSTFIDLIKTCSKYWNDRDYINVLHNLIDSPHLFTDLTETIEVVLLEIEKKLQ